MKLTWLLMVAFLLPIALSNAFVSIWDDPFRVLDGSRLAVPDENAVALARANWRETPAEHEISMDIPGMKKEDIRIEVEDNRILRISGERKTEAEVKDERWHRVERTVGKFLRQFRLPANADVEKVVARLEDGVLRITLPKLGEQESRKEPKVISINVSNEKDQVSGSGDVMEPSSKREL